MNRPAVWCHALCVPSMGENQKGFKSPVYRMKTEKTTRSQLRKGDRPWEGRLWESRRPTNRNLMRGRRDRVSWHNTAKPCHSIPEVNEAVRWRRFSSLPGEICPAMRPASAGSAWRGNASGDRAEVSRCHISRNVNRGDGRCPLKQRNPQARPVKGRTNIGEPTCAPNLNPDHDRCHE